MKGRLSEMNEIIRHIDSSEYHLWTDVLHACSLSRQANNSWERRDHIGRLDGSST